MTNFPGTFIRGMSHRGDHAVEYTRQMEPGDILLLRREPDNQFDANAVQALAPGDNPWPVGYVGKETAAWLAPDMDQSGDDYIFVFEELVKAATSSTYYPRGTCKKASPPDEPAD
jgi:hypothetical protein